MNAALALVEVSQVVVARSVVDYEIREINALELLIAKADTDVDAMLWRQAAGVVALLDTGMSERALARQWRNLRTGKPYSKTHVHLTAQVYGQLTDHPRPRFRDAYSAIANPGTFGRGDDEWYTDSIYVDAARTVFGGHIDLDPASCAAANAVVRAARFFTIADDGLTQPWNGNLWVNPPYSRAKIGLFVDKLVRHAKSGSVTAAIVLPSLPR